MTYVTALCAYCVRYRQNLTCDAFPGGIPAEIIYDRFDHRMPHTDDRGLQFLLRPGDELPRRFEEIPTPQSFGPARDGGKIPGMSG